MHLVWNIPHSSLAGGFPCIRTRWSNKQTCYYWLGVFTAALSPPVGVAAGSMFILGYLWKPPEFNILKMAINPD